MTGPMPPGGRLPDRRRSNALELDTDWLVPVLALRLLCRVAIGAESPSSARTQLERLHWTHRDAVDFVKLGEDALLELKLGNAERRARGARRK